MIAYLSGQITFKSPTHILLEANGIGYLLKITLNTYERIQPLERVKLHISMVVKSEGQSLSGFDLYGFFEEAEKDIFDKMISVSGVGAATARMMLSSFKPGEIRSAIIMENEALIQSVKGIGPKMAKRVILELKDKMGKMSNQTLSVPSSHSAMREEALGALVALGFNKQASEKAITKLAPTTTTLEALIKEALKIL